MAANWREFFNGEHALYVNDRHRALHDRIVAADVARLLGELVPGPDRPVVLDYACGEATEADIVARAAARLILSDAAPAILDRLRRRYPPGGSVTVAAPDDVAALPSESLDVVVVNSLLQYLKPDELSALLETFHRLLKPGGHFVLGDVIPPDVSPLTDAAALLRFGFEGGFLFAAVGGLVRTALSDYRRLRQELGLTTYEESAILDRVEHAGFTARRRARNLGHNQARMTIIASRD